MLRPAEFLSFLMLVSFVAITVTMAWSRYVRQTSKHRSTDFGILAPLGLTSVLIRKYKPMLRID